MGSTRSGDYSINMNANLDMSQAQKTYREFNSTISKREIVIPLDAKLDKILPKLDKQLNNMIGRKVGDEFDRINTKVQNFKREVQSLDSEGNLKTTFENVTKVVETFKNKIGEVQERVSFWDKDNKYLTSSLQTVQNGLESINTTVKTSVGNMGKFDAKITQITEDLTDTSGKTNTVITTTTEWVDAQGRLNQEITKTDKNGNKLTATINKISDDSKKAAKLTDELAVSLGKVQQQAPKNDKTSTITYVDKDGVKTVTQLINGIKTLTTTTREYTSTQGALVKETKELNLVTGDTKVHTEVIKNKQDEIQKSKELQTQLAKEREERVRAQEAINKALVSNTTSSRYGMVTEWGDTSGKQYSALITSIREVDAAGKTTIKTIQEFTNAEGQLVQQTRVTDENLVKLAADTKTVSDGAQKSSSQVKNFGKAAEEAATQTRTLGQALSAAFVQLANYYVASLPIRAFRWAITETVTAVKDFDAAITEMGKVSNYSGTQLKKYTEDLGKLGKEVARTRTEMTEAATGWLKAGYSEEDAAKLAKYSSLLQNTADEQLSAAEATSILVSQLKAYHMEADEAIKVTDIINAVSAEQAVSSYDLSQGLTVASASMATFGNSIEETTALLTAGTTIFQGRASQVARGLNMIATRVAKNEDALAEYDVAIKDSNGELRSTYEILSDLSPKWEQMSRAEQVALGNTLAG